LIFPTFASSTLVCRGLVTDSNIDTLTYSFHFKASTSEFYFLKADWSSSTSIAITVTQMGALAGNGNTLYDAVVLSSS
jgi:hypothetical protein